MKEREELDSLSIQAALEEQALRRVLERRQSKAGLYLPHAQRTLAPPEDTGAMRDHWAGKLAKNFMSLEGTTGIYGIADIASDRVYIGSSHNIGGRLAKHFGDLKRGSHHAKKLLKFWNDHPERLVPILIEIVTDISALRTREQYWIDAYRASTVGFNSKSTASGPEISIERAIHHYIEADFPAILSKYVPTEHHFRPNHLDKTQHATEVKSAIKSKVIFFIAILITTLGAHQGISLFKYMIYLYFILFPITVSYTLDTVFSWPDSLEQRAQARRQVAHRDAFQTATTEHVRSLSIKLGIPIERMETLYRTAPEIVARRAELRKRYQTNEALRLRAWRSRKRFSSGVR